MARFPGVVWAPLPEAGAPDGYTKTQFIVHSTGDNGTAAATARYFSGPTENESTFIVGRGPDDPTLQLMDSTDRADANVSANQRGISVEVVGDGLGGYNAWQRSEIIRLGIEARRLHPEILPRICPAHDAAGLGWHVMFGAPGPWAGAAKICPGGARITELKNDIFPAIFAGNLGEDDFMSAATEARLNQFLNHMDWNLTPAITRIDRATTVMFTEVAAIRATLTTLAEAVAADDGNDLDRDALKALVSEAIGDAGAALRKIEQVAADNAASSATSTAPTG